MQENGWSQAPCKEFAWYLDPCPKASTKGSGNFTHSLAAGGIQHKLAKLFLAIKERLLTCYNLFQPLLHCFGLGSKTKKAQLTATSCNCLWLCDLSHLWIWRTCKLEIVFATLGLSSFNGYSCIDLNIQRCPDAFSSSPEMGADVSAHSSWIPLLSRIFLMVARQLLLNTCMRH